MGSMVPSKVGWGGEHIVGTTWPRQMPLLNQALQFHLKMTSSPKKRVGDEGISELEW